MIPSASRTRLMPSKSNLVVKFGGTSVGSLERIRSTARLVEKIASQQRRLVVVVSAMAGETNRLLQMAASISEDRSEPSLREVDALVSTGEQVSAALLALELQRLGLPAKSLSAHQIQMATDGRFGRARIRTVDRRALNRCLEEGVIAVVAGFQGVDDHGNVVTLGRGGSDTSAVALAIAVDAVRCDIYTDVDGVYTADPRVVPNARKLAEICSEEMLELASTGSKVLQIRSVELALKHRLDLRVLSSFDDQPGTVMRPKNETMEEPVVTAISHDLDQAQVTATGLPPAPESLLRVFEPLARQDISVDFISQNVGSDGRMTISFTIGQSSLGLALDAVRTDPDSGDALTLQVVRDLAKVSIVGIGMRSHPGVAFRCFSRLTREGIAIHMALSTEIKVSCLVPASACARALKALHSEFLESNSSATADRAPQPPAA